MDGASLSPDSQDLSDYEETPPAPKKGKRAAATAKGKGKSGAGQASASANAESGASKAQQNPAEDAVAATQRKIQNRVAQREFRQRKLQYVKDLEARVEFLSGSKDSQLEALKAMLRGLLEENKQLRTLLQQVSGFVGEGVGGRSHELGFQNVEDFEEFVNRADRDTLHNIHEGWKTRYSKNNKVEGTAQSSGNRAPGDSSNAGLSSGPSRNAALPTLQDAHIASSSSAPSSSTAAPATTLFQPTSAAESSRKRTRDTDVSMQQSLGPDLTRPGPSISPSTTPSSAAGPATAGRSVPLTSSVNPLNQYNFKTGGLYGSNVSSSARSSFFFDIAEPAFDLPEAPASAFTTDFMAEFAHTGLTPGASSMNDLFNWQSFTDDHPQVNGVPGFAMPKDAQSPQQAPQTPQSYQISSPYSSDTNHSNHLLQAIQVISYHLRNKAADAQYVLPPALAPTSLQLVTPHDSRINGIIWPSLRDRLVVNVEHNINELLPALLESIDVHPSETSPDLLDPSNWEVTEAWCKRYSSLVTEEVLDSSNRWRRWRGEREIQL